MRLRVAAMLALVLVGSACASSHGASSPQPAGRGPRPGSFPVALGGPNGKIEIRTRPTRIVSLSPTATEMLFRIGAGGQVIAADDNSNFPARAPTTRLSGFEPNVEAIAEYNPDLVVASDDPGGLARSLRSLHVPLLLEPAAAGLADTYAQLNQLGAATGHIEAARRQIIGMRRDIQRILEATPDHAASTYFYELDDNGFSATSHTFIGQLLGLLGLRSIADKAGGSGSGYPQLSAEYIIGADPDVVFLADTKCCGQSARTVAARPGWGRIAAVRKGAVIALDDDLASRWGPRVVDLLRVVSHRLRALQGAGALR